MPRLCRRRLFILSFVFFLLSGCLDLEQNVKINANGSGMVSVTVNQGKDMPISALKEQKFLAVTKGQPQVKSVVREGKFQHREFVEFSDLREVGFKNETISLHAQKQGLIGFRTSQGTFEHTITPEEKAQKNPLEQGMAALLAGHTFTYRVELPGAIQKAEIVKIGNVEVEPTVQGTTATWIIPLEILATTEPQILTFKAVFTGDVTFPAERLYTAIDEKAQFQQIQAMFARNDPQSAFALYERLTQIKGSGAPEMLKALAFSAIHAGLRDKNPGVKGQAAEALDA